MELLFLDERVGCWALTSVKWMWAQEYYWLLPSFSEGNGTGGIDALGTFYYLCVVLVFIVYSLFRAKSCM